MFQSGLSPAGRAARVHRAWRTMAPPIALQLTLLILVVQGVGGVVRVAVALAALVWAPGHALLAALYPPGRGRLLGLERAGLALGLGLVLAPLTGLATSILWTLTATHVTVAMLALTSLLLLVAWRRDAGEAQPPAFAMGVPGTRATFALAGAALLVAGGLFAYPMWRADPAPAALALTDAEGGVMSLATPFAPGARATLRVELVAGDAARAGELVATLDNATLLREPVALDAGETTTRALELPPLDAGRHELVVRWELPDPRETHAWLRVEASS